MDGRRDDSSEVLLNMNGKVENNNMGEKQPFQSFEVKTEEPVKKIARLCTTRKFLIVVSGTVISAIIIVGIILTIHFATKKPMVSGPTTGTNSSSESSSSTSSSTSQRPTSPTTSSQKPSSRKPSSPSQKTSPVTSPSTPPSSSSSSSSSSTTTTTTTTPSTTTTTLPPCPFTDQFQCRDGRCINATYVCDGRPHCPTGEDESQSCECSENQFRCSSGQCVPKINRCDTVEQCYDKSDEMNCSDCRGFECASGLCMWTMSVRCNGRVQCPDLSDEIGCGNRRGYFTCDNGVQILDENWCNGRDDCFDNSDERDCGMEDECFSQGRAPCGDGTCFVHTWRCDGYRDCPGGSDEFRCGTCSGDQFQCKDYSCLDKSQVCDGQLDCPSGIDEVNCLQLHEDGELSMLGGVITAMSHDHKLPVCSDNWDTTSEMADAVCKYLGHGPSVDTKFVGLSTTGMTGTQDFVVLDPATPTLMVNQSVLARFTKTSECSSKQVVSITCSSKACGERQLKMTTPFIVGGVISPPGKWPWMISLARLGQNICGGVLIDQRWVLTAAHCIVTDSSNFTSTPHFFEVTLGTNSRTRTETDLGQRIRVDKILINPNVRRLINLVLDWDLALLHLSEPVIYGDYVQPVCLPSSLDRFPSKSQCYLAGWGYINTDQVTVDDMREGKMTLWLDSECGDINYNSTICAGYDSGLISACQGDSGGPLMCLNNHDKWTVIGIMSNGPDSCNGGVKREANKFAEVLSALDWINKSVLQNR